MKGSWSRLYEGQTITFNALVSDPDGADDIVGGTHLDASGAVTYGNFSPQGGGAFTFATSWTAIHAALPIDRRNVCCHL